MVQKCHNGNIFVHANCENVYVKWNNCHLEEQSWLIVFCRISGDFHAARFGCVALHYFAGLQGNTVVQNGLDTLQVKSESPVLVWGSRLERKMSPNFAGKTTKNVAPGGWKRMWDSWPKSGNKKAWNYIHVISKKVNSFWWAKHIFAEINFENISTLKTHDSSFATVEQLVNVDGN